MPWRKLGRVYTPRAIHPQLRTHAANPAPLHRSGSVYRVLFNGRDAQNRSSVGWADLDLSTLKVVDECREPLFAHGEPGSFFADGISIGNVYEVGGRRYLPFMGWRNPPHAHWWGELGRFEVLPSGALRLDPSQVWFGLNQRDQVSISYPWVMPLPGGGWRMWYGSTITWDAGNGEMLHVLRSADSADGHAFASSDAAVPFAIGKAQAFSRPTVARLATGDFRMWFSLRSGQGEAYRIGSASSKDLLHWQPEPADIEVSDSGWDAEMIEYPAAFRHEGRLLLLYNGNGHGASGFGLAEWT